MKIKRYFAETVRQAIGKVRDELGPDAVILSNRRSDDGVEIVVAIDYDESALTETSSGDDRASSEASSRSIEQRTQSLAPSALPSVAKPVSKFAPPSGSHPTTRQSARSYESLSRQPLADGFDSGSRDRHVKQEQISTERHPPVLSMAAMQQEIQSLRTLIETGFNRLCDSAAQLPDNEIFQRLSRLGLSVPLCHALAEKVSSVGDIDGQWTKALAHLSAQIPVTEDDIISSGGVVALVGPTGVGKTTTVAKLAARYMLRHGPRRVALVTTDNYRIGAHEQLRTYGRILDVPVRVVADQAELYSTLKEWGDKQLVLIDTAGMSQRDVRLSKQFNLLLGSNLRIKTYLVLSATTHIAGLDEAIRAFKAALPDACILTKLDEAASLGAVVSEVIKHRLAIAYLGDGQRVPEDLHTARAKNIVSHAVSLMQQGSDILEEESLMLKVGGVQANAHV